MAETKIKSFDRGISKSNEWIEDLDEELHFNSPQKTYIALKATLHALRDRLPIDEAKDFAAGLPLLLKATFYEEFKPSLMPIKIKSKEEFYALVESEIRFAITNEDPSIFVPRIFTFLTKRISAGEIEHVKSNLPDDIAELFEPPVNTEDLKTSSLKLLSPVFADMLDIPMKYSCEGENINPPLEFLGVPIETKSLALIIDDPDAVPVIGHIFDHWIVVNINPKNLGIEENSVPEGAIQLKNSNGENKYTGPCPPDNEHKYYFKLYALNRKLDINEDTTKEELIDMIQDYTIDHDEIVGTYALKKK